MKGTSRKGKKVTIYSIFTILFLLTIALFGFFIWSQQTYEATEDMYDAVGKHKWTEQGDWLIFEPRSAVSSTGIILYPGAKVEPAAYGYLGAELAENGFVVAIPSVRFNFALLDSKKAEEIMEIRSDIESWYIGGHSLGGVAAAMYATDHLVNIDGLFFLGSYPSEGDDFTGTDLPILSVYGEKDGLSTSDKIEESIKQFPSDAEVVGIPGGNHAQFGLYGEQSGDLEAEISVWDQQDKIVKTIVDWMTAAEVEKE